MTPDPRLHAGIPIAANDQLLDMSILHAVRLIRLAKSTANGVLALLNDEVFPDLLAMIRRRLERIEARGFDVGLHTTKRLKELGRQIDGILREGMTQAQRSLIPELNGIARMEAEFWAIRIPRVMPIEVDFITPSPATLNAIVRERPFEGQLLGKWFKSLERSTQAGVRGAVNIGLAEGEPVDAIVRRVRGTAAARFTDGILETSRRNAQSIVRTAVNHITTQAREATYAENQDVVKAVQQISTLDHRTTLICISLDGKVWPINDGPRPPHHFSCRSTTVPVLKSWKELGIDLKEAPPGTRASLNGQVPDTTTYPEWLRRQPVDVQNEVLGVGRARLWRSGDINAGQFIDRRLRPISLAELLRLEG